MALYWTISSNINILMILFQVVACNVFNNVVKPKVSKRKCRKCAGVTNHKVIFSSAAG